jgi:hypothetical protein
VPTALNSGLSSSDEGGEVDPVLDLVASALPFLQTYRRCPFDLNTSSLPTLSFWRRFVCILLL